MNLFLVFAFLFFIGSCLGWGLELLFRRFFSRNNPEKKWINPGFLTGPYLPLYGVGLYGMYVLSVILESFFGHKGILTCVIVFVIMAVIMTAIEYIAGLIFIKGMKVKLWDYSEEKFNIQGIICPKFAVAWGVLGTTYYYTVNAHVENWVLWLSQHLTFSFFVGMFFGVFAVDLCYSLNISAKIRRFAMDNEIVIKYEELKEAIRDQREELKEKSRFLLSFRTEHHFLEHLEKYKENRKI